MSDKRLFNPRDIAVALRYDGTSAPRVVAKGRGETAERITETAEEHQVPLHADPRLASILAQVPLGDEIPRELYVAVAEVIAFAYWLSGKDTLQKETSARDQASE
ncbi:MAG: EscU/YscU/HrcU family type III secretion system export apparatus switch protein [Methylohalobius crimeensis]